MLVLAALAPACSFTTDFPEDQLPPSSERDCADGADEDQDGLADCADNDCLGVPECAEDSGEECVDGVDNDRDERTDCEDPGCHSWAVCLDRAELVAGPRCHEPPTVAVASPWEEDGAWVYQGVHRPFVDGETLVFPPEAWRFDLAYTFRPVVVGRGRRLLFILKMTFDEVQPSRQLGLHFTLASGPVEAPVLVQDNLLELSVGRSSALPGGPATITASLRGERFVSTDGAAIVVPLDGGPQELTLLSREDGFVELHDVAGAVAVSPGPLNEWETAAHGLLWSEGGARVALSIVALALLRGTGVDERCDDRRNPIALGRVHADETLAPAHVASQGKHILVIGLHAPSEIQTAWRLTTRSAHDPWLFTDHREADIALDGGMASGPALWADPETGGVFLWYADQAGAWRRTLTSTTPPRWSDPQAIDGAPPGAVAVGPAGDLLGWRADPGGEGIRAQRSADRGLTWVEGDVALTPGAPGAWDSGTIASAAVVGVSGGYVMAYEGVNGLTGRAAVGIAVSDDGATWRKRAAQPLIEPSPAGFDNGAIQQPALSVDEEASLVRVYYQGRPLRAELGGISIGVAEFRHGPAQP